MDLWLVLLPLVLVYGRLQDTEATKQSNSCRLKCPPGSHLIGQCSSSPTTYKCKECGDGTYTEIYNTLDKCRRCQPCGLNEEVIKPCTMTSDTKCDCRKGYFRSGIFCNDCSKAKEEKNEDYRRKCLKRATTTTAKATTTSIATTTTAKETTTSIATTTTAKATTSTVTTTTAKATTSTATTAKATTTATTTATATTIATTKATRTTKATIVPSIKTATVVPLKGNRTFDLVVYLVPLVTFVLAFGLLLLCCWKTQRNPHRLFCWRFTKDFEIAAQESESLEKRSHQSRSPAALGKSRDQKFPEENSVMLSCYETPLPNQPDSTHIDRWPAFVLYAVIKEVPLRRWKEFLRLLSVNDQQMERIELEAGLGSIEKQYQMLRLWSQHSSASMKDIFSSLYYMDLSGCAQRLQESLAQMRLMPENADCNV